jgi:hypothetical protein
MPNRIIKESICTSEELANISDGAETLFYRLIVKADDFGCYYADPEIVRNICFAKKKRVKEAHVIKWLEELKNNKLIIIYEDNGKPYLQLKTFENHQQRRATKPKFPLPTSDINCYQPQSNAPINENVNENVNENENVINNNSAEQSAPPAITLTLNDGSEYPVSQEYVDEMAKLYPAVDIMQEFRKMRAWLINNPKRRKTSSGIKKFINTWLSKAQDRSRASPQNGNPYLNAIGGGA